MIIPRYYFLRREEESKKKRGKGTFIFFSSVCPKLKYFKHYLTRKFQRCSSRHPGRCDEAISRHKCSVSSGITTLGCHPRSWVSIKAIHFIARIDSLSLTTAWGDLLLLLIDVRDTWGHLERYSSTLLLLLLLLLIRNNRCRRRGSYRRTPVVPSRPNCRWRYGWLTIGV